MTNPVDRGAPMSTEEEIGRGSLWLLRVMSAAVILVLAWFLVDAIIG